MANNIQTAQVFLPIVDEVFKAASVTTDLNKNEDVVRMGADGKTIQYLQVSTNGLGDYDRNNGYTPNAISATWKTAEFNYDRGTKLSLDVMDNQETFDITFAQAQKDLQKQKVAPETDAFTFATICGKSGVTSVEATYADGTALMAALVTAVNAMDEAEVPMEGRILYITPTLYNSIFALDTIKSKEILGRFDKIVRVPQTRFYTKIELLDGKTPSEEIGGYKKANDGRDINFMIVDPEAVIKGDKHVISDIIPASLNPDADADICKYRKYGIVDVFANKTAGIYVSYKPAD